MIPSIGNKIILDAFYSGPPRTFTNTFGETTYVVGDIITFSKASGITPFPVRNGVNFKISLYGAAGGNFAGDSGTGGNSNGGILVATINLSTYQNTNLCFVRGGGGYNATSSGDGSMYPDYPGGYNGGGSGAGSHGPGGGGRTDLRIGAATSYSQYYSTELLVAGGGGGGYGTYGTNGRYYGDDGCSGDTNGDGTGYPLDNGGGGSGYYGGQASCGDDTNDAGSGSNYYDAGMTVTVHTNTRITGTTGGNTGHGYFIVEVMSVS